MPSIDNLNLPDNLSPTEIKFAVLRYGREHKIPNLWWNVKLDLQSCHSGYVVEDYTQYRLNASGGSHWGDSREKAERELAALPAPGGILVHVVEEEWSSYDEGQAASFMDMEFLAGQLEEFAKRISSLEVMNIVTLTILKNSKIDVVKAMRELQERYANMEGGKGALMTSTLQHLINSLEGES